MGIVDHQLRVHWQIRAFPLERPAGLGASLRAALVGPLDGGEVSIVAKVGRLSKQAFSGILIERVFDDGVDIAYLRGQGASRGCMDGWVQFSCRYNQRQVVVHVSE